MRRLIFALGSLTFASAISVACIAQPVAASRENDLSRRDELNALGRQLVAVQAMTQVRTSGKANADMLARMDALDAQLRASRQALDEASTRAATEKVSAEAALEIVRTRYQQEASVLFAQLQLANTELDRYREDLATILVAASPGELLAQRRFADGDFSVFDPMEAAVLARQNAEQANLRRKQGVQLRQLAQNYATMVAQGVPNRTSSELLARWDRAALADPQDFVTQIQRAAIAAVIGDLPKAASAYENALAVSSNAGMRAVASMGLGAILFTQGDRDAALMVSQRGINDLRSFKGSNPGEVQLAKTTMSTLLLAVANLKVFDEDISGARLALLEAIDIARAQLSATPGSVRAQNDLANGLQKLGEIELEDGNLQAAGVAFAESLVLIRALATTNTTMSLYKLEEATNLFNQGKHAQAKMLPDVARLLFQESIAILREVSSKQANSIQAKRDLADMLLKVGANEANSRDGSEGETAIREALEIYRALSLIDPSSQAAKSDVGDSLLELGHVLTKRRDFDAAKAAYDECLDIVRAQITLDPISALAKRQLSVYLSKIGQRAILAGNPQAARTAYLDSLQISRELLARTPSSRQAKNDVATDLMLLGYAEEQIDDQQAAQAAYSQSVRIRRGLLAIDPTNPVAQRRLDEALWRLARLPTEDRGALVALEELLTLRRNVLATNPASLKAKEDLAIVLLNVANLKVKLGNASVAIPLFEEALRLRRALALAAQSTGPAEADFIRTLNMTAQAKLAQSDRRGALANYHESLDRQRARVRAAPDSLDEKLKVGETMSFMAEIPQSGIRWRQVYDYFYGLQEWSSVASNQPTLLKYKRLADEQESANPAR